MLDIYIYAAMMKQLGNRIWEFQLALKFASKTLFLVSFGGSCDRQESKELAGIDYVLKKLYRYEIVSTPYVDVSLK